MPRIPNAFSIFTVYDISFWTHPEFHTEANRLVCQKGVLEAINNADAFSFISEFSKFDFQRMFPGWLEKRQKRSVVTTLAPRGKRQNNLENKLSTRNYWLFVGSLEPRKNVETLLDAYEIYFKKSNHPMPLKLAGGAGWKSENTNSRIDIMSETMPVEHLGYVSDSELEKLYANAFGFIFPSWYEGFGLPVVEAMNQGTPVITTLESSLREIAFDCSLNFKPNCAQELVNNMLALEKNSDLWIQLQKASLNKANTYKWKNTATALMKLINDTLNHNSS
jgi:glycosyltransferase involved in cell wall biosynthesis